MWHLHLHSCVTGPCRGHTAAFVLVLLVISSDLAIVDVVHAASAPFHPQLDATATAVHGRRLLATSTAASNPQLPLTIPTARLNNVPAASGGGYVTVLQPVGTAAVIPSDTATADVIVIPASALGQLQQSPPGQQRPALQQPQQQQGNAATASSLSATTVVEAGPKLQPQPVPPPAAGGTGSTRGGGPPSSPSGADTDSSSSSSSSDGSSGGNDDVEILGNVQVLGFDPFASTAPSSSAQQSPPPPQQQQPGRPWDQKFPFPHCAGSTLTYDASFIGKMQYAQVGTVRFAYHRFGPLGDSSSSSSSSSSSMEPPSGGFSAVLKDKISPVVFISGWGTSMYMWPVPLLKAMAATRPVLLFDNMRTGSSSDTSKQKLTIPLMADSTAALIQQLRLDKPDIWSWSLGAAVGYALLARHSNKIGNVILASGTPGGPSAVLPPANLWQQARAAQQNYIALLPLLFTNGASDQGVCSFYASFNTFSSAGQLSSPLGRQSMEEQGAALLAFFNDASVVNKLKDIPNRVLILHGVQDRLMPVRNALLGAQQLLGAWMLQFPGEGHAIPFSNVPAVIAMTEEFFSFASPLNSSSLRYWATYGQTYNQQAAALGGSKNTRG